MSNYTPGPEFMERANAIINLANEQCSAAHPSEVSASTLYATSRFNAFLVASTTGTVENMKLEKDRALEYFTDQFRKMMVVNLDDFIDNFDKYMVRRKE